MKKPSAQNTIEILNKLQFQSSPEMVAYFVAPNVILTLSGARSLCDGVFYSQNLKIHKSWKSEIASSIGIIRESADIFFTNIEKNKNAVGEQYTSFSFMTLSGLNYSLSVTNLLSDKNKNELRQSGASTTVGQMVKILKNNPKLTIHNQENLHHAAVGILLGYPDQAIVGAINSWADKDPFKSPFLVDANICGAGYYDGPMPVYQYPRNLINNTQIIAHERFWSSILMDFYSSSFHQRLAKNQKFKSKIKELTLKND